MPRNQDISLKTIRLTAVLLLSPLFFFGQTLTGLWTGVLSNDSNSVRKDQSFELALTEYRGKVFGYSRAEFIVRDTLYYIVKRVKGTIEGDVCEVTDVEVLSHNFPNRPEKGVKVSSFLRRNKKDSTWALDGKWQTNQNKRYYAVTGKIDLKEEKDLSVSKLFPHLEELKLSDDVAFYKERKKLDEPVVMKKAEPESKSLADTGPVTAATAIETKIEPVEETIVKDESLDRIKEKSSSYTAPQKSQTVARIDVGSTSTMKPIGSGPQKPVLPEPAVNREIVKIETANTNPSLTKTSEPVQDNQVQLKQTARTENSLLNSKDLAKVPQSQSNDQAKDIAKTQPIQVNNQPAVKETAKVPQQNNLATVKETAKVQPQQNNQPAAKTNTAPVKISGTPPPVTEIKKPDNTIAAAKTVQQPAANTPTSTVKQTHLAPITSTLPASVEARKSEFSQYVTFKSDSLELSLYDNGEIDGDTVSLYLNGQVLLSKQGLKATAIKKTIYLTPGKDDEFNLVLFADNLGKYPPNTGLLIVHDGDDVYNLRFSADLEKNAGVLFKRKK